MSGMLGALLGGATKSTVIGEVLQQVLTQNGGVGGLLSRFEQAGLGEHANSWVNPQTANQPLTPQHVDQVFSQDEISGWAQQAGTTPEAMRKVLAEALPQAVDHATPNGEVPPPNATPDLGSLVGRLFGNR